MPTGSPAERPHGTFIAGWPVTSNGAVFGNNAVRGSAFNDTLFDSTAGHHTLAGGIGDDSIVANTGGFESIVGGPGTDRFLAPEIAAVAAAVRSGAVLDAAGPLL